MTRSFADVRTLAEAQRSAAAGDLVAVHLFPKELGGPDDAENIVYIPPEAVARRQQAIDALSEQVAQGAFNTMEVETDYAGASFVPTRIRMKARNSVTGAVRTWVVAVW